MKTKQKYSKVRHTCVTCSDKQTCLHPQYRKKVSVLIKGKYLKGEPIVCNKWRRHPDEEEFRKWRFDEKIRFDHKDSRPSYFDLMEIDDEFRGWVYKLSKKYKLTDSDLAILNNKLKDIHIRYEISQGVPVLRYQALNNFEAYCYAVLMDDYINKVLRIRQCLECGRFTKRPKYCSEKCGNRTRVRRHRL